jgi:glutamate receptor, ionotropic, invertebrate
VEKTAVEGNRTDSKGLLESICTIYGDMIKTNRQPHVIFDTTKTGTSSETVKSLSAALGIPTVSASYGQEGDLRQWRDLSDKKKMYLLQVMPPADVLTEIVRSIVIYMNVTNAAILYDDSFVVDHKYKALLQNIPTRHVITAIANGKPAITEQIVKLRNLDINNYFILGKLESIKNVLGKIQKSIFHSSLHTHTYTVINDSQKLSIRMWHVSL